METTILQPRPLTNAAIRCQDCLVASLALLLLTPCLLISRLTASGFPKLYRFIGGLHSQLRSVFWGEFSLVGPRPNSPIFAKLLDSQRSWVKPGLIGLHQLRRRANVAYQSEEKDDQDYLKNRGLLTHIGILARFLSTAPFHQAPCEANQVEMFGYPIENVTLNDAVSQIDQALNSDKQSLVAFLNADCVNRLSTHQSYRDCLNSFQFIYADGIGMRIASSIFQTPIKENVNGTDMFPRLCRQLESTEKRVFLFGGRPGVAAAVQEKLARDYPGLTVCGTHHGFEGPENVHQVIQEINDANTDLLIVAKGAPLQELWLHEHLSKTCAKVGIGVGGLFDFFSERVSRAPQWLRELGMEWFYRFYQEPGRLWRRYFIGNVTFLMLAIKLKLKGRQTHEDKQR